MPPVPYTIIEVKCPGHALKPVLRFALACIIFSAMATAQSAVDPNVPTVTAVWCYVGEMIFDLLILVGAIKGFDRIVKEIMGL